MTAQAGGRSGGISWWSVIITSIPREAAYSTSTAFEAPQSTVITSFTPVSESLLSAGLLRP